MSIHDVCFAPEAKRRFTSANQEDGVYHLFPIQNRLNSISGDCLAEIATYLPIASIGLLLQCGDKVLFTKLSHNITALKHVPYHAVKTSFASIISGIVAHCKNLKTLFLAPCFCDEEVLDYSQLPLSLTNLVIRPCIVCGNPEPPKVENKNLAIRLANLVRLDIYVPSLQNFPIDFQYSPLIRLRLHLRENDSFSNVDSILRKVPNLTCLRMDTHSQSVKLGFDKLDFSHIPNLVKLTVPCRMRLVNLGNSLKGVSLRNWDDKDHYNAFLQSPLSFANLTYLKIGVLDTSNVNDTLTQLSRVSPLIETLTVYLRPFDLTINVFELFPKLKRLSPCLCFNPKVWLSMPINVSLIPSMLMWHFSEWFGQETELWSNDDINKSMSAMPPFQKIQFNGPYCTDKFLDAVPDRVLENVEDLTLESTPAAHRLVLLARRVKSLTLDFFNHFVDFSNCALLLELELLDDDIVAHSDDICTSLFNASIATVSSPILSLTCLVHANLGDVFGTVPICLFSRLSSLRYLATGLLPDGDLDSLPSTLKQISLDYGWKKPLSQSSVSSFLEQRKNAFLLRFALSCKGSSAPPLESLTGWVVTSWVSTNFANYAWTRSVDIVSI